MGEIHEPARTSIPKGRDVVSIRFTVLILLGVLGCGKPDLSGEEKRVYIERGRIIAVTAFSRLVGQLTQAIEDSGVAYAVRYCSVHAHPLLDSLSTSQQAVIKRATLRVRNPADSADAQEASVIRDYDQAIGGGRELPPVAVRGDERTVRVFLPIRISMPLCLHCHGQVGTDIAESDYRIIRRLYPDDNATGHAMGNLRGIWSITFPEGGQTQ
jgi:hypothetical protein